MSVQYLYEGVGKWVKDFPLMLKLSTFVEDRSFICKYWVLSHSSLQINLSKDVFIHWLLNLYDLVVQCSAYVDADLCHASEKLLNFSKTFLFDLIYYEKMNHNEKEDEVFVGSFVEVARKCFGGTSKDALCLDAVTSFLKELIQVNLTDATNEAVSKVQNFWKDAGECARSKMEMLIKEFLENTSKLITALSDLLSNSRVFQMSWIDPNKVTDLLGCILNLVENVFDHIASLAAIDFDIPLEIDWVEIEDIDMDMLFNDVGFVSVRRKKRLPGQH